jgi:hypothetical protein
MKHFFPAFKMSKFMLYITFSCLVLFTAVVAFSQETHLVDSPLIPTLSVLNSIEAANDTQFVLLNSDLFDALPMTGDSAGYRAHRIDFVNVYNIAHIVNKVILTTTNSRFSISQLLSNIPDTVKSKDTFSMIIHFLGDDLGTQFQDTIVLTIDDHSSLFVYLSGDSFLSHSSDVSKIYFPPSADLQIYPNPFSQSTTISFSSPESGIAEVTIVNLLGSEVARVFSGELSAGQHIFTWDASGMPPDMYECVLRMNGKIQQTPIILK